MSLDSLTIIPNVHAVNTTLTAAVRTNRKTFSHIAVGLNTGMSCGVKYTHEQQKLTCTIHDSLPSLDRILGRGWQQAPKIEPYE